MLSHYRLQFYTFNSNDFLDTENNLISLCYVTLKDRKRSLSRKKRPQRVVA